MSECGDGQVQFGTTEIWRSSNAICVYEIRERTDALIAQVSRSIQLKPDRTNRAERLFPTRSTFRIDAIGLP